MKEKMKIVTKFILAISFIAFCQQLSAEAISTGTHYVIAESLNERTAPNANSDIARKLSNGSKVEVLELKNGWARITKYIELSQTEKTALWVSSKYLSDKANKSANCTVLDPDIAIAYSGGCKNGLAHGEGFAKGRDSYRGSFFEGEPHGFGIYEWGLNTEWAGDRYEGQWVHGERNSGYGEYSSNRKLEGGTLENGRYVFRRILKDGRVTHRCRSENDCTPVHGSEKITKVQLKKLMGDAILKSFELDDSSIPTESRDELGVWLSDIFLGTVLDDGKSAYAEDELKRLLPELQSKMMINMLGLSLDK